MVGGGKVALYHVADSQMRTRSRKNNEMSPGFSARTSSASASAATMSGLPGFSASGTEAQGMDPLEIPDEDTINIPGISCFVYYKGNYTLDGAAIHGSQVAQTLHISISVHPSENKFYPTLIPILKEFFHALLPNDASVQTPRQQIQLPLARAIHTSPKSSSGHIDDNSNVLSGNILLSIKLSLGKTRVSFHCAPISKVMCTLTWHQGIILFTTSKVRSSIYRNYWQAPSIAEKHANVLLSCTVNASHLQFRVKHAFSPEDCLLMDVKSISGNIGYSIPPIELVNVERASLIAAALFVLVDAPLLVVDLNVRHLQDVLILGRVD